VNEKEALNLVGLVLANFPNMQEKDMRPTAALWCKMLSDVPYQTAEQALLYVLSTAKFFPTVAEIREAVVKITTPELPAPMEAWAIGRRIAKKYSPARMMDGDFEKAKAITPPLIWRVIEYIGWRDFCFYGDDYMRSRFVKAYEIEVKREQERMHLGGLIQLPEPERKLKAIDGGKK
jgi:hypothetical protein